MPKFFRVKQIKQITSHIKDITLEEYLSTLISKEEQDNLVYSGYIAPETLDRLRTSDLYKKYHSVILELADKFCFFNFNESTLAKRLKDFYLEDVIKITIEYALLQFYDDIVFNTVMKVC